MDENEIQEGAGQEVAGAPAMNANAVLAQRCIKAGRDDLIALVLDRSDIVRWGRAIGELAVAEQQS